MSNILDQFWHDAQALSLTAEEKALTRTALRATMASGQPEARLMGVAATMALSDEERQMGRSSLQAFMQKHPAGVPVPRSIPSLLLQIFTSRVVLAPLSAMIIVVVAATGAAEAALPGDVFYPVKIHVTEQIRSRFATTPDEQREWAVQRLERRLSERDALEQRGTLTEERRKELEFLISMHTADIERHLESIPEDTNDPDMREFEVHLQKVLTEREEAIDSIIQERVVPEELAPVVQDARATRERVEQENARRRDRYLRIRERLERRQDVKSTEVQPSVVDSPSDEEQEPMPESGGGQQEEDSIEHTDADDLIDSVEDAEDVIRDTVDL